MDEYQAMGLIYRAYVATLILIAIVCIFQSKEHFKRFWDGFLALAPIRRTALVMIANVAVNALFVSAAGIHDPWLWYIVVDSVSAVLVIWRPAWLPQGVIAGLYGCQLAVHVIYKLTHTLSENRYWVCLIVAAILQLLTLGGWYLVDRGRIVLDRWRGARMARAEGRSGGS